MGFGTLFFGYFLLLDLPYQTLTNVAAASLMLIAFYKLAYLNRGFKLSFYACAVFGIFALGEATLGVLDEVFFVKFESLLLAYALHFTRNLLIGATSFLMLKGMRDVAGEVGLKRLSRKCDIWSKITFVIYAANMALVPDFSRLENSDVLRAVYTAYVIVNILTLFVIVMNLTCIFSCYSSICMPSENRRAPEPPKKSRFGFVNRFREHEDEKRREYAEYKMKKRQSKGKKR